MEQTPALTMSDRTAPPTREPTPGPDPASAATTAAGSSTTASAEVPAAAAVATDATTPTTATDTAAGENGRASSDTVTDRLLNHGLYTGSINEEVGQVMGTLTSFWGGFKKQSASALSSIKKDMDKTVAQVQEDFKNLQTAKVEIVRKDPATWEAEQAAEKEKREAEKERKEKGKEKATDGETDPDAPGSTSSASINLGEGLPPSATAFFNRIQSSTSQLQQSLQTTFNHTLAEIKSNPALSNPAQLRAQLAENLRLSSARENLQLSLQQAEKLAEEYLKKGEGWVKDGQRWVEDNVRVVPPEGEEGFVSMGIDGTDFYSFSTSAPVAAPGAVLFDAGGHGSSGKSGRVSLGSSIAMAGSRKEALLRRLREDKDLLLVDPAGESESQIRKDVFAKWTKEEFEKEFKEQREKEEGFVGGIRMALVPESLTDEQFWQRYLFHKHMLEAEEERRKALLQATAQTQQDDFSWDDEPESPIIAPHSDLAPKEPKEETPSLTTPKSGTPTPSASGAKDATTAPAAASTKETAAPAVTVAANKGSAVPAPVTTNAAPAKGSTTTSPRDSEESYDLVSDQGVKKPVAPANEEDEDSDWE